MKNDFLKFEISKKEMNALRGGEAFLCTCGNGKIFTSAEPQSATQLVDAINSVCGESGGSCVRS